MLSVKPDWDWLAVDVLGVPGFVLALVMLLLFIVFFSGVIWWMAGRGSGVFDGAGGKAKIVGAVFGAAALAFTPAYVPWIMNKFSGVTVTEKDYDWGVVTVGDLKEIDTDNDGSVSVIEIDTNNDGDISEDEAQKAGHDPAKAKDLTKKLKAETKKLAQSYDTSGNGKLSLKELDTARDTCVTSTSLGKTHCENRIAAIVKNGGLPLETDAQDSAYGQPGGNDDVPENPSNCYQGGGRVTGYDEQCIFKWIGSQTRTDKYFVSAGNAKHVVLIKEKPASKKACEKTTYDFFSFPNSGLSKTKEKETAQHVCEAWWDNKAKYPNGGRIHWP